tara:strand:- start:2967 stop:3440 length:474 start_codon:yes stop_codon:yes gene_type:complete
VGGEAVTPGVLGEVLFFMDVPIKAISKERPRVGKAGHVYTPQRTRDYEEAVALLGTENRAGSTAACPVALSVTIRHTIPASWKPEKKAAAQAGHIYPTRGDLDNKVKAISDALNGIAYVDDVQICQLKAEMIYATDDGICVKVTRAGYTLSELRVTK